MAPEVKVLPHSSLSHQATCPEDDILGFVGEYLYLRQNYVCNTRNRMLGGNNDGVRNEGEQKKRKKKTERKKDFFIRFSFRFSAFFFHTFSVFFSFFFLSKQYRKIIRYSEGIKKKTRTNSFRRSYFLILFFLSHVFLHLQNYTFSQFQNGISVRLHDYHFRKFSN